MTQENTQTFTANKDGTISVKDAEGKDIRYAKESDLLAIKGSAEAADKRALEMQDSHKTELATATSNFETARQGQLQAEAKISGLEEKVTAGTGSAEELAKIKLELETAKKSGEELTTKALEYRRQIIATTYQIPVDTVKDKSMVELDHYEEALKAVTAARGTGNYAIGGTGAGAGPETPLDRAKATIDRARERGPRTD